MFQIALLQLCIAALAFAAPIANEDMHVLSNAGGYGAGGGLVGFIVLVLDILVWSKLRCYENIFRVRLLTACS
jgi:hypothetical protein